MCSSYYTSHHITSLFLYSEPPLLLNNFFQSGNINRAGWRSGTKNKRFSFKGVADRVAFRYERVVYGMVKKWGFWRASAFSCSSSGSFLFFVLGALYLLRNLIFSESF